MYSSNALKHESAVFYLIIINVIGNYGFKGVYFSVILKIVRYIVCSENIMNNTCKKNLTLDLKLTASL